MSYADFQALGEDLKTLLIPLLFLIIFFLYKIGNIVLKLHINDKAQDLKHIQQNRRIDDLKQNCKLCATI